MQLHFDGSTSVAGNRQRVYGLLTDPNFIAKNLPDAEGVRVIDASSLEGKMKVRIAVVSSRLSVRMSIIEKEPPTRATLVADGSGSGSTVKIRSTFTLVGNGETRMEWSADADINGVMAGIGSTLLKGYATKKVSEIFTGITKAIEEQVSQDTQRASPATWTTSPEDSAAGPSR